MGNLIDVTGQRFGRLTVERRVNNRGQYVFWLCICDCGAKCYVRSTSIRSGVTKSCGCLSREISREVNTRHGGEGTPEYWVWAGMVKRCSNSMDKNFGNYGGRGIYVCERWKNFVAFIEDMGPRPSADHQLDRIDNDGPYSPENCRWASRIEQANNKRNNRHVHYEGERYTLPQLARRLGVHVRTLRSRFDAHGWPEGENENVTTGESMPGVSFVEGETTYKAVTE